MTAKRKNTRKDLIHITELVQECLDNFAERDYYKSPHEDKPIDNLKEVIKISERWLSG